MASDTVLSFGGGLMRVCVMMFIFGVLRLLYGCVRIYDDEGRGFLSGCLIISSSMLLSVFFVPVS